MNLGKRGTELILVVANMALTALMIALYAVWLAPRPSQWATLDVAKLYQLKELQVATTLMKHDAGEAERAEALKRAANFGAELSQVLQTTSQQCACLILVQGAVATPSLPNSIAIPDLTPQVRRQLGL